MITFVKSTISHYFPVVFPATFVVITMFALPTGQLHAQELMAVENPPMANYRQPSAGLALTTTPSGDVSWTVHAKMVEGKIFNPATGINDKVFLRAYRGDSTSPQVPFVAPTVDLEPGNTFRLQIVNDLPADDPSCELHAQDVNIPHCFNSTNMHTHGLWVSPAGNGDNVLLRIDPDTRFTYEHNIPSDHPSGTFWYHPHLHGSTALQVSSGMSGALIIRGDRLPGATSNGDLDTLLVKEDGTPFRERVVLLQQIQYACRDSQNNIKTNAGGAWVCDPGDTGRIENYDQFGPGSWQASGRFTTINGLVIPVFDSAVAGEPERWRIIHAGVRDSVNLRFHKLAAADGGAIPKFTATGRQTQETFVDEVCAADPIDQFSVATDGLTRAAVRKQYEAILHPGYREDLLMVFSDPGVYCVIDGEAPGNETVSTEGKSRKLLGYVRVGPGNSSGADAEATLREALVTAAQAYIPGDAVASVVTDLNDGLKLTKFVSHVSLMEAKIDATRTVGFLIGAGGFQIGEFDAGGNLVNAKPYDPDVIDRLLPLDATEEWHIRSFFFGHPFHIHVNPFQIVEILDENGNDVSNHDPGNTSPYAGLKGAWKDTIFAANTAANGRGLPYRIRVRTHYRRYIGKFVLHCHILDHEDQGMMQNVEIGLPDAAGGIQPTHH